ncbi:DUF2800 domain-containing protein [Paenibacillus caseinilyticus]|uniref:DUF2800 domain-containing protein n=1 Tax=Paenibacillus caseinilyticus TaxID=3098138 RepID=UPI0022B8D5E3|nr:DUF2800 domain-containing protein [Paenibacillus caseinilyticus]MCZ8518864.1 DUF2800 domain-containing protein [Paenibacillus caseinilyticus]
MSTAGHAARAHARLSASGSKRWLSCTPSAALEDSFEESSSSFADEGTAAHELSELHLARFLKLIDEETYQQKLQDFKDTEKYYSQSMDDFVQVYVDIVIEKINEARARCADPAVLLEQKLDFSNWVPDGFGTGDVVIVSDGVAEVIDLKFGKGVPVSAEGNPQMRLYALGAYNLLHFLYEFDTVRMTIVQPRLDSISTDELSVEKLLQWAEEDVKPKALMAEAGEGEYVPGEHCRFCRARASCRARARANLALARFEFADPPLLTNEEIAEILKSVDDLKAWASDIAAYALKQARDHGVKYAGWKVVEGRSNRKITDELVAADVLLLEGYAPELIYKPKELLGISDLEKAVGKKKFKELLSDLIIKPAGKPALVPEEDKRVELSSGASAAADFAD